MTDQVGLRALVRVAKFLEMDRDPCNVDGGELVCFDGQQEGKDKVLR